MYRLFTSSVLPIAVSVVVAHAALAGGEPKDERPFTGTVPGHISQLASAATHSRVAAEQKNEAPFTRLAGATLRQPTVVGESKNELPFTAAASPSAAAGDSGSGFSWMDAVLGGVLGVSLSIAAAGATLLARRKVPRPA